MTDANHAPITVDLARQERVRMIKAEAEAVSAHMSVDQLFQWESLGVNVSVINQGSVDMLKKPEFPNMSGKGTTMMGLVIFVSRKMPPDRIEFRNAEGEKVGEIVNLPAIQGYEEK